jgi:hypothetical protein
MKSRIVVNINDSLLFYEDRFSKINLEKYTSEIHAYIIRDYTLARLDDGEEL